MKLKHLKTICFTVSVLISSWQFAFAYERHINCAGETYLSGVTGITWVADVVYPGTDNTGYIGGTPVAPWFPWTIGNGELPLYEGGREGSFEYRFDVPNGWYEVELGFAERFVHGKALRIFNVIAETDTLLAGFDIFARVRKDYAIHYSFAVQVTDGRLNVVLNPNAFLSTISVYSTTPDMTAPVVPDSLTAVGGYNANLLFWKPNTESDIAGYNIYRSDSLNGTYLKINTETNLLTKFFDSAVLNGSTYYYKITVVDIFGNESAQTPSKNITPIHPAASALPLFELFIPDTSLLAINSDVFVNNYVSGTLLTNNTTYNILARYRGGSTRWLSKKNWKIKFPDRDYTVYKMNTKSEFADFTLMQEKLSFDVFAGANVLVPDVSYMSIVLNDEYQGVYLRAEQLNKDFLVNHGKNSSDNIYKVTDITMKFLPNSVDYATQYEKKTNKSQPNTDIQEFIKLLNRTDEGDFKAMLETKFYINELISFMAVAILVGNGDFDNGGYYLFHNVEADKWELIPWDNNNNTMGISSFDYSGFLADASLYLNTIYGSDNDPRKNPWWNTLFTRTIRVPEFRQKLYDRLTQLQNTTFSQGQMNTLIQTNYNTIADDVQLDMQKFPWEDNRPFLNSAQVMLNNYVAQRNALINEQKEDLKSYPFQSLVINEFMPANASTLKDKNGEYDDWLEIRNISKEYVNLSKYYITDDLREVLKFPLPDITLPPDGYTVFWCDNQPGQGNTHLPFTLDETNGGEIGIFKADSDEEAIANATEDVIWYGIHKADVSYGRSPDTLTNWHSFSTPTPWMVNRYIPTVNANNLLNIYPNPNNGQFTIEIYNPDKEKLILEIHNSIGQLMVNKNLPELPVAVYSIDLSTYARGGYHIKVTGATIKMAKKIVIQ